MVDKPRILVFLRHYLPGFKTGGPLRSLANLVEHLKDEFDFYIVTQDRDLGDSSPYPQVKPNIWHVVGNCMVQYLPPESSTIRGIANVISTTPHDLLYLNSFFDFFGTIKPLTARRLGLIPLRPVVIAPRGEFSAGALRLKYLKKFIYIQVAKSARLYKTVIWQASSEYELLDIKNNLKAEIDDIHIAIDLPPPLTIHQNTFNSTVSKTTDKELKVIFLSRISQKKNLDYALRILKKVSTPILFDIYGPKEDLSYWNYCLGLVKQLPPNIILTYKGEVSPDKVSQVFNKYDLFFFPTLGENYGHVIAESLLVGTPVLISDQTPWRDLKDDELGWDVPLANEEKFIDIINHLASVSFSDKRSLRHRIQAKTLDRLIEPRAIEANRELFRTALKKSRGGIS